MTRARRAIATLVAAATAAVPLATLTEMTPAEAAPARTTTRAAPTAPLQVASTAKGDLATAEPRLLGDPNTLWVGTFENNWQTVFGLYGAGYAQNTTLSPAPSPFYATQGTAFRVRNNGGGTSGDAHGYDGRFTFDKMGIAAQDEAYLRYYVYFPANYEWDTQGKMPGLQGVVPGGSPWWANSSNGAKCTSGPHAGLACHDYRQFGARTMWKGNGMITYLNVVYANGKHHNDVRNGNTIYSFSFRYKNPDGSQMTFKPGWNYVEQHVKMNTPGHNDGIFEGWINGVRGIRLTDVQYRAAGFENLNITQWNLAHFWGGPSTDFPVKATDVHYDDIVISRSPIGARQGAAAGSGRVDANLWLADGRGRVVTTGAAQHLGDAGNLRLNQPVVSMVSTSGRRGYWLLARDGGVFSFGDARFHGSTGNIPLNQPVNGMAASPSGAGYWLVASDGGIFAFGDARFHGSTGNIKLNRPVNGMAVTPSGGGYWLVASDGGIFAFGDARFHGSAVDGRLGAETVGIATTPTGGGYWMTAGNGRVAAFGDARHFGDAAGRAGAPIVRIQVAPDGEGYWLVASDGTVHSFGSVGSSVSGPLGFAGIIAVAAAR